MYLFNSPISVKPIGIDEPDETRSHFVHLRKSQRAGSGSTVDWALWLRCGAGEQVHQLQNAEERARVGDGAQGHRGDAEQGPALLAVGLQPPGAPRSAHGSPGRAGTQRTAASAHGY